ncbi:F0F1 ATP synthase subunit epsilon [Roseivivax sediminis]|uniref:ATP synthase epsilon chain n=1 Tax=Roseivivax sediminis TaxID=936889 RepID=A0A1I2BQM9_9RHOB|nr:F0F1 ATP synthase subunit epsilon [Roseivivax sediminis]SFE57550.1 ATP synthase F1 subcomplex epsilon subunit [Roseivivax sediminis]
MAETMNFDLVSPERRLLQEEVVSVQIPGADGDMTAMPNHAPLITTLRPGLLTVETAKGETRQFVVTGGFAELGDGLSVLAERALPREEMDQETYEDMVTEAEERYRKAKDAYENEPGPVDDAAKLLADMVAVGGHIGLSERQPNL